MRDVLKQGAFLLLHHLLFRKPLCLSGISNSDDISGINGQVQRASKINEHLAVCSLPKRNAVQRSYFRINSFLDKLHGDFPASMIYGHR
jgi:hypothetical protein